MFKILGALTAAIVLCFSTPVFADENLDKAAEMCNLNCILSGLTNKLNPPAPAVAPSPPQVPDVPKKAKPAHPPQSPDPVCDKKVHPRCKETDQPKKTPVPKLLLCTKSDMQDKKPCLYGGKVKNR